MTNSKLSLISYFSSIIIYYYYRNALDFLLLSEISDLSILKTWFFFIITVLAYPRYLNSSAFYIDYSNIWENSNKMLNI